MQTLAGIPIAIWVSLIAAVLSSVLTAIVILIGIWQFSKTQKWKKLEVLHLIINEFRNNEQISFARKMLDWDKRNLIIDGKTISYDSRMLIWGLRIKSESKLQLTPEEEKLEPIIKDVFDAFFTFFRRLSSFEKLRLLKFDDLVYFHYWFELLNIIGKQRGNEDIQRAIDNYIDHYGYSEVRDFLNEYKRRHGEHEIFSKMLSSKEKPEKAE